MIYINQVDGRNSETCLLTNNSHSCKDLNWVLQQSQARRNSTHLVLSQGYYNLWEPTYPFDNLNAIAISGSDSFIRCNNTGIGLAFIKVKNVVLKNITFSGCGSIQQRSIRYYLNNSVLEFKVGLYFSLCENLTLDNVHVQHTANGTGVVVSNTTGINSFNFCQFSYNILNNTETAGGIITVGGGGFLIDMNECISDDIHCDNDEESMFIGTEYRITSCLFEHNEAGVIGNAGEHFTYILERSGFSCGGGLSVFMKNNASGVSVTIGNCSFVSNVAFFGGGVFLQFNDVGEGNSIHVLNSNFVDNNCLHSYVNETSGGAIRWKETVSWKLQEDWYSSSWRRNEFLVENCFIRGNKALKGGAIAMEIPLQNKPNDKSTLSSITNSSFQSNVGKLGSAIYLEHFWKTSRREGVLAELRISSSYFEGNTDQYYYYLTFHSEAVEIGIGTVYLYSSVVNFTGNNTFYKNYGSAVALMDSDALFDNCQAYFTDNMAHSGAAMSIMGSSTLSIGNGTLMRFENNTASYQGGAIYSSYLPQQNLMNDGTCFIRHVGDTTHEDDWNVSMIFVNNTHHRGNTMSAIYTTSVSLCDVVSSVREERKKNQAFCWKGWVYYISSSSENQSACQDFIDTYVGEVKFIGSDANGPDHVKAFPGWEFRIPIRTSSDYGSDMSSSTIFNLRNNVSSGMLYNWGENTSVAAPENMTVNISVETAGDRIWYFHVFADMQPCPPGFVISAGDNDSKTCQCANSYNGLLNCDKESEKAEIVSGTWIGKYNGKYYVASCPIGYCDVKKERFLKLPNNSEVLNEYICSSNRKGILCGECKEGYGPSIGIHTDCVPCSNTSVAVNIVKYLSLVYLPLTIGFLLLIFFDIRLTTGAANAFILYSQLLTSIFGIDAEGEIPLEQFTRNKTEFFLLAYKVPYGIFNLRFLDQFIPICLSTKMNSLDVVLLNYGIAFFPLVMKVIIIMFLKAKESCCDGRCPQVKCTHRSKNINNALLPAFAAFLLLSYSRVSITSVSLMRTVTLVDENGSVKAHHPRLRLAGQYSTQNPQYYYYIIPGVIVLFTFVAVVPLLLLDYPLRLLERIVAKSSFLTQYYPVIKIHILTETFQGCYRKNRRCFAGLYFLFRLIVNISYVYSESWLEQFVIQQIITLVFIILLSLLKPYKKRYLNYIDILMFANLAVINSFSLYFYVFYRMRTAHVIKNGTIIVAFIVQYVLVFIPLLAMGAYILFVWKYSKVFIIKILIKVGKWFHIPIAENLREMHTCATLSCRTQSSKKGTSYQSIEKSRDAMDTLWERAEDKNRYKSPSVPKIVECSEDSSNQGSTLDSTDAHGPIPSSSSVSISSSSGNTTSSTYSRNYGSFHSGVNCNSNIN